MNLEFAQTVIGFDLDFLNEPSNNDVVCEAPQNQSITVIDNSNKISEFDVSQLQLQKKPNSGKNRRSERGLSYLKKKIIDTNNLVEQYHARYDQVAKLEVNLLSTKDKLRDVCIEKDLIKQNYETLDKESDKLRSRNKELERKLIENGHIHAAIESHTRQLEQLLKDRDTQIDGFKVDINLKRATIKELEKRLTYVKRYKEHLITQICNVADVVFTRRTLTKKEKITLFKYMRLKKQREAAEGIENTCHEEQNYESDVNACEDSALSDADDLIEVLPSTQEQTKGQYNSLEKNNSQNNEIDTDVDVNSEVISVDTGRGSSLAFSGSEKNLNSPEYYLDSPTNSDCHKHKEKYMDSATSPILVKQYADKCTSPFKQEMNTEPNKSSPVRNVDKALSTMRIPDIVVSVNESIDGIEPLSSNSEMSCLESNHSGNLVNDNTGDCEVEMILNTMKLNDRLITPIPPTPGRSAKSETCQEHTCDCPQAAKVNKDTEALQSAFAKLASEFSRIKKKVVNLENTLVNLDKHSDLHNDRKTEYNVVEEQESFYSNEDDKIFENVTSSNNIPECVETTSPVLQKELTQMSKEINNDDLHPETEANINNKFTPELKADGVTGCLNNTIKKTIIKAKKLTRLEKLRKNLMPKSKIRNDLPPPRVLRSRMEKISNTTCGKVNKADSVKTLNNKDIYEKAVKVMAEIKSQQKAIIPKRTVNRKKGFIDNVLKEKDNHQSNKQSEDLNSANDKVLTDKASSPDIVNDRISFNQHSNVSLSETDKTNDSLKTRSKEKSVGLENERRRKSFPPETESISSKTRTRYSSLSVNKYPVVLLTRSDGDSLQANTNTSPCSTKKCLKRGPHCEPEIVLNKKILRSAARNTKVIENNNNICQEYEKINERTEIPSSSEPVPSDAPYKPVCYDDLDLFNDNDTPPPAKKQKCQDVPANCIQNPKESVLCKVIDDVGVSVLRNCAKKVPETVVSSMNTKIAESISAIIELPQMEIKKAMDKMIKEMEKWEFTNFIAGLMQYLMDPTRKLELFNKINGPPAPPMTKSEQVLLYMVSRLRLNWQNRDVISCVLNQIEYILFRLNQTPELRVVESMSHFYAILCRYINNKSRLRIFMVNAMYCMQYSAVALVKQCIEVWMHILPLAHMGLAKSPMVSTLVYLLHFYKCDDNTNMVKDIRNILKHKYFFNVTDWDVTKVLDMFRNAIMEINDNSIERKMLRLSLILLAKRHGTKWCQNKIINNMLLPIIATEGVPERVKAFCISMLGPLFKPYPEDMRVHCGIVVNQLMDILAKNPSPFMEEVTYTSLICLSKHNQNRVIQALLTWQPKCVTPYMESVLKDYVKEKPVKAWKAILSKVSLTT